MVIEVFERPLTMVVSFGLNTYLLDGRNGVVKKLMNLRRSVSRNFQAESIVERSEDRVKLPLGIPVSNGCPFRIEALLLSPEVP